MELVAELEKLGLSDKEARVYLANLELGQSSVQNIAKKAQVNRATTYVVLDSLIKKGLCSTFEQDKKTYYIATEPQALEGIFEIQKKEIEERQKQFENLLPQLKLIDNTQANKPGVKFYEGKQGLINCYNEFVTLFKKTGKDSHAYLFYPKDSLDDMFTEEEVKRYRKFRQEHNVPVKTLYTSTRVTLPNTPDGVRIKIPGGEFPVSCDIGIHENSMRILLLVENRMSGILITDPDVARTFCSLFELAWEGAEAREKKSKK